MTNEAAIHTHLVKRKTKELSQRDYRSCMPELENTGKYCNRGAMGSFLWAAKLKPSPPYCRVDMGNEWPVPDWAAAHGKVQCQDGCV